MRERCKIYPWLPPIPLQVDSTPSRTKPKIAKDPNTGELEELQRPRRFWLTSVLCPSLWLHIGMELQNVCICTSCVCTFSHVLRVKCEQPSKPRFFVFLCVVGVLDASVCCFTRFHGFVSKFSTVESKSVKFFATAVKPWRLDRDHR